MLGKLLKYEIMATGRIFLPLYLGLLVVAIISSFTLRSDIEIISVIFALLLFALYTALVIVTIILLIQRFYQNLLKDEGYLMFTIPVTPATLIASKLITACMWCILSMIVGIVAGLIVMQGSVDVSKAISEAMSELNAVLPGFTIPSLVIILFTVSIVSQLIANILHVYVSLAVGQLPPFGRYKILFAVITYLVIATVISAAVTVVAGIWGLYHASRFESLLSINEIADGGNFDSIEIIHNPDGLTQIIMADGSTQISVFLSDIWMITNQFLIGATIFNLVFSAAAFIGTSLILKKKLNLE
jgi:hypothetical protein